MTDPVNITIMSCIYGRPRVTKTFIDGLIRLKRDAPDWVHLKFLLVYSNIEDLLNVNHSIHDFDSYFNLVYAPNRPLGRKHNFGLSYAVNCGSFDYILQLGSDDVLSNEIWGTYRPYFRNERKFFGLNSVYLYDSNSDLVKCCESSQVFGAGRCIHSSIVRQFVRTTGYVQLWDDNASSGLDINSEINVSKEIGFSKLRVLGIRTNKPMVLDIKTKDNINPYASMPGEIVSMNERFIINRMFPELVDYAAIMVDRQRQGLAEKIY